MSDMTPPQEDFEMSEEEREKYNLHRANEIEENEPGLCTNVEFDGEGCPIPGYLDKEWEELSKQVAEGGISEEAAFVTIMRRAGYLI